MKNSENVAIFWDYENCPASSNISGYAVVNSIRSLASPFGSVKLFKAYLEISEQLPASKALPLRSELQSSGVSLIDCPHNGRKNVADKMLLVDMLTHAIDTPAPSTIILISGDRDFAYALSVLRLRQYRIVLVTLPHAHASLTAQASICFDWIRDILGPLETSRSPKPQARSDWSAPTCENSSSPIPNGQSGVSQTFEGANVDVRSYLCNRMQQSYQSRTIHSVGVEQDVASNPMAKNPQKSMESPITHYQESIIPFIEPRISHISHSQSHSFTTSRSTTSTLLSPFGGGKKVDLMEGNTDIASQLSFPSSENGLPLPSNPLLAGVPLKPSSSATDKSLRSSTGPQKQFHNASVNASKSSNATPAAAPLAKFPTVPDIFSILVKVLQSHRAQGNFCPLRSIIGLEISKGKSTYKTAGVKGFGKYVTLAEEQGIVQLGGMDGEAWIRLKPAWFDPRVIP